MVEIVKVVVISYSDIYGVGHDEGDHYDQQRNHEVNLGVYKTKSFRKTQSPTTCNFIAYKWMGDWAISHRRCYFNRRPILAATIVDHPVHKFVNIFSSDAQRCRKNAHLNSQHDIVT